MKSMGLERPGMGGGGGGGDGSGGGGRKREPLMREARYGVGSVLVEEGEEPTMVYVVVEGECRIVKGRPGRSHSALKKGTKKIAVSGYVFFYIYFCIFNLGFFFFRTSIFFFLSKHFVWSFFCLFFFCEFLFRRWVFCLFFFLRGSTLPGVYISSEDTPWCLYVVRRAWSNVSSPLKIIDEGSAIRWSHGRPLSSFVNSFLCYSLFHVYIFWMNSALHRRRLWPRAWKAKAKTKQEKKTQTKTKTRRWQHPHF